MSGKWRSHSQASVTAWDATEQYGFGDERLKLKKAARPLTAGEIELARSDLRRRDRLSDGCGWSGANGGRSTRAASPWRRWATSISIPHADLWSEDFAREPLHRQGLFIHELTHVWQTQKRGRFYLPLMRHPFCRYGYDLEPGRRFEDYGLEQQAEIVRHRFLADRGASSAGLSAARDSAVFAQISAL